MNSIYKELKQRIDQHKQDLIREIKAFVNSLETENRLIVEQNDKIQEFQELMNEFFKEKTTPFLVFLALKIKDALSLALSKFDEEPEYEMVRPIEEALGIKDGKIQKYRDGKMTVLYAIGALKVLENDMAMLLRGSFMGTTLKKDLAAAAERIVSRKHHDFFEVYTVGAIYQSYNAAVYKLGTEYGYPRFKYLGGLIEESRDFCVERNGHEFTREQGWEWNDMEWKGKIPGVSFFIQVGGYNCRHYLEWVKDGKD